MDGALVVGVSQSGQSPDIVSVLEEGKRQGRPTLAITNDGSSPLAAAADHVIELHAGLERSVAATKTYTAQLAVMALLAATWSGYDRAAGRAAAAARGDGRPRWRLPAMWPGGPSATATWISAWSSAAATTTPPRSSWRSS